MALRIRRWLEAKRAPQKKGPIGNHYTPIGIDIYTTDDPALVKFEKRGRYSVRVKDLLSILDELDAYEARGKLEGEKMEIELQMIKPVADRGDVYHFPGFLLARPSSDHPGLVCLEVFNGDGIGSTRLTAERDSLRTALEDRIPLAVLEIDDRAKHGGDDDGRTTS